MTDAEEITAFLTAQHREDEAAANAAADAARNLHGPPDPNWRTDGGCILADGGVIASGLQGDMDEPIARHIALHNPASALAAVAGARAILAEVIPAIREFEEVVEGEWGTGTPELADRTVSDRLLHLLVAPYAGRPGFKPEWSINA